MEFAGSVDGSTPVIKKYQIDSTFANAGVIALAATGNAAGLVISSTTSFANAVGVTLDTATYITAQQSGGANVERVVSVIVNPGALYKVLLSGTALEGGAMVKYPITTEDTSGLTAVTSSIADWSSPAFDESTVWFADGLNVGQKRKVTSVSSSTATFDVAFNQDVLVGHNLYRAPYSPLDTTAANLAVTTNLYQANTLIAVGTGGAALIYDMDLETTGTKSTVSFLLSDHVTNVGT